MRNDAQPHVVIVGGGFGGLTTAQAAARLGARITLVDRTNHHLFQPLLYQVATAGLTAPDIAAAIRSVLAEREDVTVLLDEVVGVDLDAKTVRLASGSDRTLSYDYLVLAAGARPNYLGHDEWAERAPGMKSISDALEIRKRFSAQRPSTSYLASVAAFWARHQSPCSRYQAIVAPRPASKSRNRGSHPSSSRNRVASIA